MTDETKDALRAQSNALGMGMSIGVGVSTFALIAGVCTGIGLNTRSALIALIGVALAAQGLVRYHLQKRATVRKAEEAHAMDGHAVAMGIGA